MIIYHPSNAISDTDQLKQTTSFLAQKLFPACKTLGAPYGGDPARQLLRIGPLLVELQLYTRSLGEETFETLLKSAVALETRRKEQQDPSLVDIGICILARSFSNEFLTRLPSGLVRVNVFEMEFIRSDKDDAVVIREIKNGALNSKSTEPGPYLYSHLAEESESASSAKPADHSLSTPELIAFARLGMELRSRRSQAGMMSGD